MSLIAGHELQVDGHVSLALVDELLLRPRPGVTPQRPGDGVEEGGLTVSVLAAETCDVERFEVEHRGVVPVAHEVLEG